MRTFTGVFFVGLGLLVAMSGIGELALVLIGIGALVLVTGRGAKAPEPLAPPPPVQIPRVSEIAQSVLAKADDVAELRATVAALAERVERAEAPGEWEMNVRHLHRLEDEVRRVRQRLDRMDGQQTVVQIEIDASEAAVPDDPSAVDALARLLDRT